LISEDGTDRLSRNVGKELPALAAQFSSTLRRKPEITQSQSRVQLKCDGTR
jgi:hypothetical protein